MTRVLLLSCHLSGTGHVVRTLRLSEALRDAGAKARIVSGGRPLDHVETTVDMLQLPPLRVQGLDFTTMLTPQGAPADAAYMARRVAALAAAVAEFRPDALVTELFPLGRRRLAGEFEGAIAAARAANSSVRIIASVRDVPEPPSGPERISAAAARLRALYDLVIVHGDEAFLPLTASWPLPAHLGPMIRHCGYVGAAAPAPAARGDEVLVSVGGGDLGRGLLEAAAVAARASPRPWRLLVGGADAATFADTLAERHRAPNLTVEPVRQDFRLLLARAACSVSLAGYNTATDLAATRTPAVLVPDETAGEREQAMRADALARFPGITRLSAANATPKRLAAEVERLAGRERPPLPLALDGAGRAAHEILTCVAGRAEA